jgi:hypothetical protein
MKRKLIRISGILSGIIVLLFPLSAQHPLCRLTHATQWKQEAAIPLRFNAYHTQGLVKIGEYYYLSSVEVTQSTKKYAHPQGRPDRDAGKGRGHLFKFDRDGNLLQDLLVGEGDAYHPGGIDYDGAFIWVPVTEYRPHSFSIIYKINPETMKAEEVMRYDDSIGAIIHDTDGEALVGVNWDAREFYRWTFDAAGKIDNATVPPDRLGVKRGSFYIAYQDCQYLGRHLMLCSGLQSYQSGETTFQLGGWEIIDLRDFRPVHQVPVNLQSPGGQVMTGNPCTVEISGQDVRAYFVPDDGEEAVLFIYKN